MPEITKSELIRLQKKLKTDQVIGDKFGVTRQAIHQLRQRLGVDSRYVEHAARNEKIKALYKKGLTGPAIARKLGLSVAQTYNVIRGSAKKAVAGRGAAGRKKASPKNAQNEARNAKIKALYDKGVSGPAIAKKLGLSAPQIYNILKAQGPKSAAASPKKRGRPATTAIIMGKRGRPPKAAFAAKRGRPRTRR